MESFVENFLMRHFNAIAGLLVLFIVAMFLAQRKSRTQDTYHPIESKVIYAGSIKAIMEGAHPGMEDLIEHLPGKITTATKRPPIKVVRSGEVGGENSAQDSPSQSRFIDTQNPFVTGVVVEEDGEDSVDFLSDEDIQALSGATEVFDITQSDEEEASLGSSDDSQKIPEVIFRKYDIRGVVGETLTNDIVYKIGQAVGSDAAIQNIKTIAVGRDGRLSSPELSISLIKGICSTGTGVIDIGVVPTPVLYFATHHLGTHSGIMVTGSHNGPEYNGLKIVLAGNTLSEEEIQQIYARICESNFSTGTGDVKTAEIIPDYLRRISDDIPVAIGNSYKLVIDCGNGAAAVAASQLYRALGHDVVELYCELDGNFPNHHPDPSQPENLEALINKVKEVQADLGFAFDGDGDRLGVVDNQGKVLWPDRQMMLFARDVLSRNKGADIIFDVKCSSHLKKIIEDNGGKPLMWKTGHSLIKSKMKETQAPLAGEMSGHIFFSERWYGFDDALYSGARLLEILMKTKANPAEVFAELPDSISTPELKIDMPEAEHQVFMKELEAKISFDETEIISIDGFRVEFKDGWGLIRPSNTTPCLVVRFEADTPEALSRMQRLFKDLLLSIKPELSIPF
jgi:phosphomannomutase/phosphoglucomutase